MTPIEKNIIVVDEQGREYEATYPKRAKGLVKNGRARFIGENKICLACPPDKFETEDIKMSEHIEKVEAIAANEKAQATAAPQYTVEYILGQIAEIQKQTAYLNQCLTELSAIHADGPEDPAPQAKANAMADVVRCRETTNQQLIGFYEKMYDKIVSSNNNLAYEACINCIYEDDSIEERAQMLKHIHDIFIKDQQSSLLNEAQGLVEFIRKLEETGEISELVYDSVIDPLVSTFQMNALNAQKSD